MRKQIALLSLIFASVLPASAQVLLTNFGTSVTAFGSWSYTAATSTLSGTEGFGDVVYPTDPVSLDITGYSQLSLTASVTTAPGAGFTVLIEDQNGVTAAANFAWTDFSSGGSTVIVALTPDVGFDPANVVGWTLNSGGSLDSINASLTTLQVVPEPTTWALLAGGLTALMVFRRRRRA